MNERSALTIKLVLAVLVTVMVLGLYAMSGSWHSLWPMVLMLFSGTPRPPLDRSAPPLSA